jgi:1-acyl-sn-glycerol-3-phosphate acyltransferase
MGAFRAAFRAGRDIAPIVISGARAKLPSESWLPRPGPLAVQFRPRIAARDYPDESALLQATRQSILDALDEPDLDRSA